MEKLKSSTVLVVNRPKTMGNWLQVLSHLDPVYGGIAASVPALAEATEGQSGFDCPIAAFCENEELAHGGSRGLAATAYPTSRTRWMMDTRLRNQFKQNIQEARGVHIHGIWETHCALTAGFARTAKRPYIVSAHGMLDTWALNHKRLKKALYAALVETRTLQRAACLRALTADEVDDYRRVGLTNPIAIIPSGIDIPARVGAGLFRSSFPELTGKRIVLFLGRLHPKKGLAMLMRAWAEIEKRDDAHLVIAGPDSEGTLATLEQMTDAAGLRDSVTFAGMLSGERKWSALAAASLFVLPSYSEGFSIAVLEAMASGLPVMVTTACHIPEVAARNCGWVIRPDLPALKEGLSEFFSAAPQESAQMGERGRALVNKRFRWPVVGRQMSEVYEWLQGGEKPREVEVV